MKFETRYTGTSYVDVLTLYGYSVSLDGLLFVSSDRPTLPTLEPAETSKMTSAGAFEPFVNSFLIMIPNGSLVISPKPSTSSPVTLLWIASGFTRN